jgi:hypothetical protein
MALMAVNTWASPDTGYLGKPKGIKLHQYMVFGEHVHKVVPTVVKTIRMGDVEDPDLYVAQPICDWQATDAGQWVMENSVEMPMWKRVVDQYSYGYEYRIIAYLKEQDVTFWSLKWGLDEKS